MIQTFTFPKKLAWKGLFLSLVLAWGCSPSTSPDSPTEGTRTETRECPAEFRGLQAKSADFSPERWEELRLAHEKNGDPIGLIRNELLKEKIYPTPEMILSLYEKLLSETSDDAPHRLLPKGLDHSKVFDVGH